MSFFENLKISSKVTALLVLLGLFALVTSIFTAAKMQKIDDAYALLLAKDVKATVLVARMNTRLIDTGRLAYMMIAETDGPKMQAIDKELIATADRLHEFAGAAKTLLPRKMSDINAIVETYDSLLNVSKDIRAKALANDNAVAMQLMRDRFDPVMTTTRMNLNSLIEDSVSALDKASSDASLETTVTIKLTYVLVCTGLAFVVGLSIMVSRRYLSRPIVAIGDVMHRLALRDYAVEIPGIQRRDEVGVMAQSVQVFKEGMIRADEATAAQERDRQERELRAQRIETMTRTFDNTVSSILGTVAHAGSEMQSTASSMSSTAEETTRQAGVVAAAAEEASANVQTVASASEELASSIHEISRQVNQSAQVAATAADQSARTNDLVQGLAQSALRIGEVVNLINNIASQTNLLALNATIEAARAGEAGKGFAVVANEVKTLANQTGKATDEIAQQVAAVQSATEEAVRAIQGIGITISEINQISTAIASAVEEQGAATQEIARNVQQAAEGTQQVTQNIGGVSEAATETGHSAHSVLTAATGLVRESDSLRRVVDDFLKEVRAA
jgi:methyl-accepting chemotaxis protein